MGCFRRKEFTQLFNLSSDCTFVEERDKHAHGLLIRQCLDSYSHRVRYFTLCRCFCSADVRESLFCA